MQNEKKNTRKVLYLFLAVLVAAGIWYYADAHTNNGGPYTKERVITDIPVTYTGVDTDLADRGLMLLEDGTDATVDLKVEGGRLLVSALDVSDIRIVADLSNIESPGIQTVTYRYYLDGDFAAGIEVKKDNSTVVTVNISELYSRVVDVKCELIGNVAEGYSAGQLQLSADTLEIRGQAEDIDPVSYAKVTLDLGEDAVETVSKTLTWQFYDKDNQLLDDSGIHPTVESVQATLPVYVTKELQLVVNFKEYPGARARNLKQSITPPTITVSGDAAQLKNIDSINLGTFDLMELLGNEPTNRHSYSIIIPDGCQNLSGVTRATLTVAFEDMIQTEIVAEQFEAINVPEGRSIRILTEELPVTIFGTTADVEAITSENITVIADLSDYSAASGTYTVPATVQIASSGDVGVSGTYQVRVTIQEQTEETPEE